jgi:hypothetical protein
MMPASAGTAMAAAAKIRVRFRTVALSSGASGRNLWRRRNDARNIRLFATEKTLVGEFLRGGIPRQCGIPRAGANAA